jgi:hypothetical protein
MSDDEGDDNVIRFPARGKRYHYRDERTIPLRPWIMRGLLLRKQITAFLAPGGVGKSNLGLAVAQHLAAGLDFGAFKCVGGPKQVALFSVEEDPDELDRRLHAIRQAYDLPRDMASNLMIMSAEDSTVITVTKQGEAKLTPVGTHLERLMSQVPIDVMIIDPFVEVWAGDENSNIHVRAAAAQIRGICRRLDCACLLMHHVRKGAFQPGDMDVARGASSFAGLVRLAFTLSPMTKLEAEAFGVSNPNHIRLDHAKGNYLPPADRADWFRFQSVELANGTDFYPVGDKVGVLKVWEAPKALDGLTYEKIGEIIDMIGGGPGNGERYGFDHKVRERWCGNVVVDEADVSFAKALTIVKTWRRSGLLYERDYQSPTTKRCRKGVYVDASKRPSPDTL